MSWILRKIQAILHNHYSSKMITQTLKPGKWQEYFCQIALPEVNIKHALEF